MVSLFFFLHILFVYLLIHFLDFFIGLAVLLVITLFVSRMSNEINVGC